jgi:hypothetical protein
MDENLVRKGDERLGGEVKKYIMEKDYLSSFLTSIY